MHTKVSSVERVSVVFLRSMPPTLRVEACGTVPTGGWGDGQLVPRLYITPPADGLWDFDFIAKAPAGIAIDLISPITAVFTLFDPPKWVKGARVHASLNSAESPSEKDTQKLVTFERVAGEAYQRNLADGVNIFPWLVTR